uniref:DUF4200 domain-containing protein n=1 Tax=Trepomonas sp. PC1 TaxID=1076344 RepID=A0A146K5R6_9EUKA|eukprot:JAP91215.1 hypothetical protein TPC1_17237 [Trepomonas sp. PC1]
MDSQNQSGTQNPFNQLSDLQDKIQTQQERKYQQKAYFNMSIQDKTRVHQLSDPDAIKAANIKKEDRDLIKFSKKAEPLDPPVVLPETFRTSRREGIKQYIERQKEISKVVYNTAMKQVEIEHLNKQLQQQTNDLEMQELKMNKEMREMQKQMQENDDKSIFSQKLTEEFNLRLDETRRKSEELRGCLNAIFQEIYKEIIVLEDNLRAREMVETVGLHSSQADLVNDLLKKRQVTEKFFEQNQVTVEVEKEKEPEKTIPVVTTNFRQKPTLNQKLPQKLISQKKELQPFQCLKLPDVIKLAKHVCSFGAQIIGGVPIQIDFDFEGYVKKLGGDMKMQLQVRPPSINLEEAVEGSIHTSKLEASYLNIFERLKIYPQMDSQLQKAIQLLKKAYDTAQIPFQTEMEFINNLNLLEDGNLVRTQHLQDVSAQIETQIEILKKTEQKCFQQEQKLQVQVDNLVQKVNLLQIQSNKQFDRGSLQNSLDDFVYDLNEFQSLNELQIEKYTTELDLTHQCIAQAGVYAQAITVDDRNMHSNTILGKMELIQIETMNSFFHFKQDQFQTARKELARHRRDLIRKIKKDEMDIAAEKSKKRQLEREEKSKHIIPVQKKVFTKAFVQPQKKTLKQIQLEQKLAQGEEKDAEADVQFDDD